MDDPNKKLEALLFPETQLTQGHREYLQDITSFSLLSLRNEPQRLERINQDNAREMADLAFNNYKTFIQSTACTTAIHNQIDNLGSDLSKFRTHLPELSSSCQEFVGKAQDIAAKRKLTDVTLGLHNSLLELLEVPQLMETCVKNHCYEEALELEQFTRKLARDHPNNTIIKNMLRDVELLTETMVHQLHKQLSGSCNLSEAFKVISHLKRLGIYSDTELKVAFLQCRDQHMQHLLSLIPSGNYFMNVSKMIDTSRSELQDIISQFSMLFVDSDQLGSKKQYVLQSWIFFKVNQFLDNLQQTLLQIKDTSFLPNILSSCMFFGKSLERFGCDFRPTLIPIFETVILQIFDRDVSKAVSQFGNHLRKYRNLTAHQGLQEYTPAPDSSDSLPAPPILLDFPPLAIFANAILNLFNELRTCWLFSIQTRVATLFQQSLSTMIQKLADHKALESSLLQPEYLLLEKMCQVAHSSLVPYLVKCFNTIFNSPRSLIDLTQLQESLSPLFKSSIELPTTEKSVETEKPQEGK